LDLNLRGRGGHDPDADRWLLLRHPFQAAAVRGGRDAHLAYRWFCRLDLDDQVPDHSTFSVNRHGRFRSSNIFRQLFEAVVRACMDAGLVQDEGFAVDASVMEASASRYRGKAPDEIDWSAPERHR
jgi:hypothetical protein